MHFRALRQWITFIAMKMCKLNLHITTDNAEWKTEPKEDMLYDSVL